MVAFSTLRAQVFSPAKPTITAANAPSQVGKVFIVTGGNSGIGYELCKALYGTGATVYMAARSSERAKKAIDSIVAETQGNGKLVFLSLDLNDLDSTRAAAAAFAEQEDNLDVLINNAGLGAFRVPPQTRTAQGHEAMMGIHCVATLLFTKLLVPRLRASPAPRVVWTASIAVEDAPMVDFALLQDGTKDPVRNYGVSKIGTWMLGSEFARRHANDGILSVTINPGNVRANSYEGAPWWLTLMMKPILHEPSLGASTGLFAALSPDLTMSKSGVYIIPWGVVLPEDSCRQDIVKAMAPEEKGGLGYAKRLWEWCEEQYSPRV